MNRRELEFVCSIIIVGLLAGLAGMATTVLLHFVEHLTYAFTFGPLLEGVTNSSPVRRAVGPMIGGALAGFGWWILRRHYEVPGLAATIANHRPIPRIPLTLDATLQILVVGSGASLGREGAPRQFAAVLGDAGMSRWALTPHDREILLACAAGAGLGAVYCVPAGGALFATQIMMRTWHPRALGAALISSALAVAVASPVTHVRAPLEWPKPELSYLLTGFALVLAPLAFAVGTAFNRIMAFARPAAPVTSWLVIPGIAVAGLLVGLGSVWWPELPGNGKSILTVSLNSALSLGSAAVILLLKPLLTAIFLRAGAEGGMLTPALATGAALGSLIALAINTWTGQTVSVPAVSLTCAAGVLAVTQGAPLWAALFVWELARPPVWVLLPFLAAALAAHGLHSLRARRHDTSAD
ncbi:MULTISPECIES: chloride channel protein [unclassified Mycolicibacterium]|uniref:chloride channel protein n=1 Tax=unclassified Mycolicibacterium TaxID=2636767 RepID=UPI0013058860|nr:MULTISPECIES: chloride channel protein [unclassified Mycolicibacterium]MUL85006.1 chloride ion channel protein [Mycolicibacterium sp. CBMA 329]MUL90973.1 chloride ion channel protein [Mycolicibacterium sp. CBMA 331]MUL98356.1 chloride ion channel protein [Mycolicibacterium sp. CBMA 334]MUM28591.1 chloride ion channel protein [Mycolicibacterium sp. CBMA 295]MUM40732.1 chloride ion channel protein [Mycolicibacterium sp. CBMA 247]